MDKGKRKEYQDRYQRQYRARNRLRYVWYAMIYRCYNPKDSSFSYYGGRGIRVYPGWESSFEQFKIWALSNGYKDNLTIDRISSNGDYTPENCRFATRTEQMRNRRDNRNLSFRGKTQCLAAWAKELGMSRQVLDQRLKISGWDIGKALSTPINGITGRGKESYRKCIYSTVMRETNPITGKLNKVETFSIEW